jgi:23S rRNA (uracil1939-C5)-methyltransferase
MDHLPALESLLKVTIHSLESQGEGRVDDEIGPIYVPKALPDEIIEGSLYWRRGKQRALRIHHVIKPSPDRAEPICSYYDRCGGCSLQHLTVEAYKTFKLELARKTLQLQGLTMDLQVQYWGELGQRRRVSLSYRHEHSGIKLGFFAQHSNFLVAIEHCPLLTDGLNQLLDPLKVFLTSIIPKRAEGFIHLTDTLTGIDISWSPHRFRQADLTNDLWQAWGAFALEHKIARVTRAAKELLIECNKPKVQFGTFLVDFPPAAFLQPSIASEQAMTALLIEWMTKANLTLKASIADLFCGLGTFSAPASFFGQLTSIDSDGPSVSSLEAAVNRRWTVLKRDLFTNPLRPEELNVFELIILDPPRAGAFAQVQQLAQATVPHVIMISCDLSTCARDLKELLNIGYVVNSLKIFDQFPFTPHLEAMIWLTKAPLS